MLAAWLLAAGVLLVGGAATLRRPEQVAAAFTTLRVPRTLHRRWVVRTHPVVEILLAVLLLVLPAPGALAVAVVALLLFSAYLLLVWRAVARGEQAACHCFGALGSGTLDGWAVTRNAVLWAVAALVVVDASLGGSARERLAQGPESWAWGLALAATAAVTYLVTRGTPAPTAAAAPRPAAYLPVPVPDVALGIGPDETRVPLAELAADRPQLLLLLNPTCGPCTLIGRRVAGWVPEVPGVDFRIVNTLSRQTVQETAPEWAPHYGTDEGGEVDAAFGRPARPAGVLLTRDGAAPTGPVIGAAAIERLVGELRERGTSPGTHPRQDTQAASGSGVR